MCIIVVKPMGVNLPTVETLETCFKRNPDGAGFMFNHDGKVYGFKGLMTFADFMKRLREAEGIFGDFTPKGVVLHFRIGTTGSNIPGNTHPFPLGVEYDEMKKVEWVADQGFAHNGIISKTSYHADIKKFDVSDTMVFARYCVNPIAEMTDIVSNGKARNILDMLCGGKLAFMNGTGVIQTTGDFNKSEGCLYSNYMYQNYASVGYGNYKGTTSYYPNTTYGNKTGYFDADNSSRYSCGRNKNVSKSNVTDDNKFFEDRKETARKKNEELGKDKSTDAEKNAKRLHIRILNKDVRIFGAKEFPDGTIVPAGHAFDPETGDIYTYDSDHSTWIMEYSSPYMEISEVFTGNVIHTSKTLLLPCQEV